MRIRAKATIRNDKMLSQRERLGLSQIATAKLANVPIAFLQAIEALDYSQIPGVDYENPNRLSRRLAWQRVRSIADVLELTTEDVVPRELSGKMFESTVYRVAEIENAMLARNSQPLIASSAADEVSSAELRKYARRLIDKDLKTLSWREREIVRLRYGLDDRRPMTLDEVGDLLHTSRERVRQLEAKAIRKLQRPQSELQKHKDDLVDIKD